MPQLQLQLLTRSR